MGWVELAPINDPIVPVHLVVHDRWRDVGHTLSLVARIKTFRASEVLLRGARRLRSACHQMKRRISTSLSEELVLTSPFCAGVFAANQPGVRNTLCNPCAQTILLSPQKRRS